MRKDASLDQWKELYEVTMKIKEMEPWNHLWDMDIITIMLPGREEPCYFSIMGRGGECFGISTYVGFDGLNDFYEIADSEKTGIPVEYVMFEQSNLSCSFSDREEVPSAQKKIIKDLGLKFRGKKQWIYFESYKKGYIPYILDADEVFLLTKCYQQLHMALRALIEENLKVDFEAGETLVRNYDEEKKMWLCFAAPMLCPRRGYPNLTLQDDLIVAKMKKQKQSEAALELDIIYMNSAVKDKKFDRPVNPKLLLLMDHNQRNVIGQDMLTPEDDEVQAILNIFVNFIMQYGRPMEVHCRNPYIGSIIEELCKSLDVKMKEMKKLPAVDELAHELRNRLY